MKEKIVMRANVVVCSLLAVALLCSGIVLAQKPVQNISGKRHPNLAAAQHLCEQAFQKITAAQQANEFDMEGHAQKAKDLLDEANRELKQAAEAANRKK
jgi:F0F1-type ATP synthase membrane subunit b/b'